MEKLKRPPRNDKLRDLFHSVGPRFSERIAMEVGVTRQMVFRWMARANDISLYRATLLAKYLGVSLDDLSRCFYGE